MFKVNNKDTRTTVFIVKFEQIMQKQLPAGVNSYMIAGLKE